MFTHSVLHNVNRMIGEQQAGRSYIQAYLLSILQPDEYGTTSVARVLSHSLSELVCTYFAATRGWEHHDVQCLVEHGSIACYPLGHIFPVLNDGDFPLLHV
jgi:hypothetical protein